MNRAEMITAGKTRIGMEFGSTRIKAVLIGEDNTPLASGVHDWQNTLADGVWTYPLREVHEGMRDCFADLMQNVEREFGVKLTTTAGFGVSAMMHGYLVFDKNGEQLVPFRTWRNTMTEDAASRLTNAFLFNIPQRWSIAHLYQAILNDEAHIDQICFLTTLAGYVHFLLTGEKVIGIGDASGIFPIDPATKTYDAQMMAAFDALTDETRFEKPLSAILPKIVPVGECAGKLTEAGARLLDPTGTFPAGIPFCPPEGDAQTGMAATNSIAPRTGNVSAGTSIFSMIVLEQNLKAVHREIDIVTTPCGDPVAMVHCNSCTTDLDAWVKLFGGLLTASGHELPKPQLYDLIYDLAAQGDPDCGGVISYNYYAGEPVTGLDSGKPLVFRSPDSAFTISNLARSLVYSTVATLKLGMDILTEEQVKLDRIYAHGGLFKNPVPSQRILAAALGADITLMESAGEGGAWGIALLASYMARDNRTQTLQDFLNADVFKGGSGRTASPEQADIEGMQAYMKLYKAGLSAERAAAQI